MRQRVNCRGPLNAYLVLGIFHKSNKNNLQIKSNLEHLLKNNVTL